jgi:hypothetical protein
MSGPSVWARSTLWTLGHQLIGRPYPSLTWAHCPAARGATGSPSWPNADAVHSVTTEDAHWRPTPSWDATPIDADRPGSCPRGAILPRRILSPPVRANAKAGPGTGVAAHSMSFPAPAPLVASNSADPSPCRGLWTYLRAEDTPGWGGKNFPACPRPLLNLGLQRGCGHRSRYPRATRLPPRPRSWALATKVIRGAGDEDRCRPVVGRGALHRRSWTPVVSRWRRQWSGRRTYRCARSG